MTNRLVKRCFLGPHKVRSGIQRLLNFMFHLIAHHPLARLHHRHVLFQTRNIQFQRVKGDRQPLIAEVEIFPGILCVVEQLMGRRAQRK